MKVIADLQLHSRFSRAVSSQMVVSVISQWAKKKGIGLVATGDWTHPIWLRELKSTLEEAGEGVYRLRGDGEDAPLFLLSTEVSSIYSQGGRTRRIHTLIFAPNFDVVEKINKEFVVRGANLMSDGRPIVGLSARQLAQIALDVDSRCLIIPAHCLLPDTYLEVNPGIKKIKDVEPGDRVLTHNGRYKRVKEVLERDYSGKVIKVIPWYFTLGLTTTPEHPFLAIKTVKKCRSTGDMCRPVGKHMDRCSAKHYSDYKKEWVRAGDLEKGDVVLFPRLREVKDKNQIIISRLLGSLIKEKNGLISPGGTRRHLIPDKITVDEGFLRLAGYYLAEGYTAGDDISFALHADEEEIVEDIKKQMQRLFGVVHSREYKRTAKGTELIFHSKILSRLFSKLFYKPGLPKRANVKKLPTWMLYLPPVKQKEILKGWWLGDKGYTNSQVLLNQMKALCLRLGIIPSIRVDTKEAHKAREKHDKFDNREIRARQDTFSIDRLSFVDDRLRISMDPVFSVFKAKLERRHGWMDEKYAYMPIRKIERVSYSGQVYNLEVEEDNSYTSEFATVHNCWTPWFSLYGSMSGFDSIEECFGGLSSSIYAIETGLSCYDGKTEVLTEAGWKKVSEVKYKDKVCTLNIDTDEIEFQRPRRIFAYNYKGKMYKLRTKRVDLFVTPNHKLLVSHCDFRKPPEFRLKEAQSLFKKSKRFKKNGLWNGKDERYFVLPAVRVKHGSRFYSGFRKKKGKRFSMKSWLKFFGFWIAEGWTTAGRDGDYNVCISNQDQALMSEIKQILESFGHFTYWDKKRTNTLRVRDYQLFCYLRQFGKASEKYVPLEIKGLSKELLKIFFDYYLMGDGHRYGRSGMGMSAVTISTRLRDDLQEIALKIGISAYYKLHNKKGTLFSSPSQKKKYRQSADSWVVYFIRRNRHAIIPSEMKKHGHEERWVKYNGMVYCVSVPNRTLYIRRNGIPVWCGNSDPAMNWRIEDLSARRIVSFSDAHSPQKLGREATIFELPEINFSNIRKAIIGDSRSKISYTIEFYPEEGKYHYTGHRNCKVVYSPKEARKKGVVCPVCGKNLTVGVMSRVEHLASAEIETEASQDEFGVRWIKPKESALRAGGSLNRRPYVMFVPLLEILGEALDSGVGTQTILTAYDQLINSFGSEFDVLLKTSVADIQRVAGERVADGIKKVRSGDIVIEPGYDGVFGKVKIWSSSAKATEDKKEDQMQLF